MVPVLFSLLRMTQAGQLTHDGSLQSNKVVSSIKRSDDGGKWVCEVRKGLNFYHSFFISYWGPWLRDALAFTSSLQHPHVSEWSVSCIVDSLDIRFWQMRGMHAVKRFVSLVLLHFKKSFSCIACVQMLQEYNVVKHSHLSVLQYLSCEHHSAFYYSVVMNCIVLFPTRQSLRNFL